MIVIGISQHVWNKRVVIKEEDGVFEETA